MAPKKATRWRPVRPCTPTASSSWDACLGLTTTRRSTASATFGAFHFSELIGLLTSTPTSTAYSSALCSTALLRRTVLPAAAAGADHAA